MASDSRADNAATSSVRRAVGPLVAALSRAVFGVCAVAIGALTLLLAAGATTSESATTFLLLGLASVLVGVLTISRLPKADSTSGPDSTETGGQDG